MLEVYRFMIWLGHKFFPLFFSSKFLTYINPYIIFKAHIIDENCMHSYSYIIVHVLIGFIYISAKLLVSNIILSNTCTLIMMCDLFALCHETNLLLGEVRYL